MSFRAEALKPNEHNLGAGNRRTFRMLNNLALLYSQLGHYFEAEPIDERYVARSE